jgi:hypothetical protein
MERVDRDFELVYMRGHLEQRNNLIVWNEDEYHKGDGMPVI